MTSPSNSAIFYSILFFLPIVLFLFRRQFSRKLNLPPGPRPWPLIGNLNLIGPLPHVSIHSLSQKYGPLMHLKYGLSPVVVGSSAEVAELLLKTHDISFASRPALLAGKYTTYNYSAMSTAPYGPYWRQARKICLMELLSAKRLDQFEYIRVEERNAFLSELFKSASTPVHLKDRLYTLNLTLICRMVLGKRYTDEAEKNTVTPKDFTEMIEELFLLIGILDIGDSIPWLASFDLQGHVKRMKDVSKKLDKFYEGILDEHHERRKSVKGYGVHDMVDVLMQLADDPSLEVKLEREHIKALIQDLLTAGTDTSAISVEWAMSELLKNPEAIQKATEELDRVIGKDRWVEEKDIVNLPYIEAIVKETMRLHPVAPLLLPRVARDDCRVAGYDILRNTRVVVNVWAIGRDPTMWEKPNEFRPHRFIDKNIDVKGHDFQLLPFGSGRRICPGYALGLKVIQSTLANLLYGFEWKLPGDMKNEDLDMEDRFGLTMSRKTPLVVVPSKPRLSLHLYSCE
ncbi:Flavonoid 3-monooxygenase [Citrus sinensis]|nr:Flavonoid 3-monooxygenase [Citrus sinensis]